MLPFELIKKLARQSSVKAVKRQTAVLKQSTSCRRKISKGTLKTVGAV